MKQNTFRETATCSKGDLQAVKDALETLRGKWKLQILISLLYFARDKKFDFA